MKKAIPYDYHIIYTSYIECQIKVILDLHSCNAARRLEEKLTQKLLQFIKWDFLSKNTIMQSEDTESPLLTRIPFSADSLNISSKILAASDESLLKNFPEVNPKIRKKAFINHFASHELI